MNHNKNTTTTAQNNDDIFFIQRDPLNKVLFQRAFLIPSFEIYNGISGFYDLGPPACAIKHNVLTHWRNCFIIEEDMLEVECSQITPEPVLKASGHVDRFTDIMIKDSKTGKNYRADKLLEDVLTHVLKKSSSVLGDKQRCELEIMRNKVDTYSCEELDKLLKHRFHKDVLDYLGDTQLDLETCQHFNLMFATTVGPDKNSKAYLRPETAQGIFVNFPKLLAFNGNNIPFAAAQIGNSFRNEIAPRNSLLRVREFCMAEIEYFVDPLKKNNCPKFNTISNTMIAFFPKENQLSGSGVTFLSLKDAVEVDKFIDNKTLAYFIYKTYKFLIDIGIRATHLRFRQHLDNEMAHYASDCWDAEIYTSYGWIECVGIADRSCFDLTQHAKATGKSMMVTENLSEPIETDMGEIKLNKKLLFQQFGDVVGRKNCNNLSKKIEQHFESCENIQKAKDCFQLNSTYSFEFSTTTIIDLPKELFSELKIVKKKEHTRKYYPNVIEPSFGIGRILYALFEHSFYIPKGKDAGRVIMKFKPSVAPTKCAIICLIQKDTEMMKQTEQILSNLRTHHIQCKIDRSKSSSIGKQYSRFDELGIPYVITVDKDTMDPEHKLYETVTLRYRDTRKQDRLSILDLPKVLENL